MQGRLQLDSTDGVTVRNWTQRPWDDMAALSNKGTIGLIGSSDQYQQPSLSLGDLDWAQSLNLHRPNRAILKSNSVKWLLGHDPPFGRHQSCPAHRFKHSFLALHVASS